MFSHPCQFEPLLPDSTARDSLLVSAHRLQTLAARMQGPVHAGVLDSLTPLLRSMNSYYTNLIEGQQTRPKEIEQALAKDFSSESQLARKQHIAVSHIAAEQWGEAAFGQHNWRELFSAGALKQLHRALFDALPADLKTLDTGGPLVPGAWRERDVVVGQHVAPQRGAVDEFVARWALFYSDVRGGELALLAVAASHQRLAWIHPFEDGNGRVARLHSHLLLRGMGLSGGLWSPLRGLARSRSRYYELLAAADMPRQGDLDGRGNLSQKSLSQFIEFFLETCIEQVSFMTQMLNFDVMKQRIAACLQYESHVHDRNLRIEALQPLHYAFMSGPLERGDFKRMTGLSSRLADRTLKALLDRKLLRSDTPQGKVFFSVPLHALRFYFPALWPEAEADAALDD